MKRIALIALTLMLGACAYDSAFDPMHRGKMEPAVPVSTAEHPNARNYLPELLGSDFTEAEYPLFSSLNAQPLETTRPLLEKFGMIRDYKLIPWGATQIDDGELRAINDRYHLQLQRDFATPEGPRSAWIFQPGGPHGGNDIQTDRIPFLLLLTTADYQPIQFQTAFFRLLARPKPASTQTPGTCMIEFSNKDPGHPDRICFTSTGILVSIDRPPARGGRAGNGN